MLKKTYEYLTGRYHPDLVPYKHSDMKLVHHEMVDQLDQLKQKLEQDNFNLFVLSGHRNHLDQLRIWNEKVEGIRPILDEKGNALDVKNLSDEDIVKHICRWSAIPGASRHHWGTDIDVYCKNSLPSVDYKVQLTPQEVNDNGIFGEFHLKIDELMNEGLRFYRPYEKENGGVSPERWHLSYYPLAEDLLNKYSIEIFEKNIIETDIHLKEVLLHDLEHFYENYVLNVSPCPKDA